MEGGSWKAKRPKNSLPSYKNKKQTSRNTKQYKQKQSLKKTKQNKNSSTTAQGKGTVLKWKLKLIITWKQLLLNSFGNCLIDPLKFWVIFKRIPKTGATCTHRMIRNYFLIFTCSFIGSTHKWLCNTAWWTLFNWPSPPLVFCHFLSALHPSGYQSGQYLSHGCHLLWLLYQESWSQTLFCTCAGRTHIRLISSFTNFFRI